MKNIIAVLLSLACALVTAGCSQKDSIDSAALYDKNHYIETYKGDLDSNLSVFPNTLDHADSSELHSSLYTDLFDVNGYIVLKCSMSPDTLQSEVERLRSLTMTVHNFDGETYTNEVHYDTAMYNLPAYIAIDGFGHTYEYALIDEPNADIVYVYLAYPNPTSFPYPDYLKRDDKAYTATDALGAFSLYNHSFDGGKSWVEFDD